jgi:hypothetical protein
MSFDLQLSGGDIVFSQGDVSIVENGDLLVQNITKLLSTPKGSNTYIPAYGSLLDMFIGSGYTQNFSNTMATQEVLSSLGFLQSQQKKQLNQNQIVTQDEQLGAVLSCDVSQAPYDLRLFQISVTVVSKSFQNHNVSMTKS